MVIGSNYEQHIRPNDNHCVHYRINHVAQSKKDIRRGTCRAREDNTKKVPQPVNTHQIQGREKHSDRGDVHLSI